MKKDEIIAFLQQLVESQKHLVESQNRQIDDLLRQVASLTDEVASLKALLVQKGEEEEKTKRALKVLGKLNRNKSEKQTLPAQGTETPGNNNNTATEEPHGKKERPHTNNGAKRKVYYHIETVLQEIQERREMVPPTCMFPTCEKEVPRQDSSRQDDTTKDGEI